VRIVSLLPSTTEILFAIGAGDDVVGVTFECDFPPEACSRRIVSTSTTISPAALSGCGADLVVVAPCGYGLAGAGELAAALVERDIIPSGVPVWAVDADAVFVRPGPRLVDGIEALAAICHPGALPPRPDLAAPVGSTVGEVVRSSN
jgi:ABC-type Fe3+-hydroxamate transport system substrate-binding protein